MGYVEQKTTLDSTPDSQEQEPGATVDRWRLEKQYSDVVRYWWIVRIQDISFTLIYTQFYLDFSSVK